ncbi:MAG: class I SAM-dependent methyltransferase [Victivallaceae bacterium]|nr:class I SAM-dependent methyltransferase [Victivallaceae bacterium]
MKIRDKFNKYADSYDNSRKQLIPGYSDFYGTIIKIIPFSSFSSISVLDLGAGTGLLSELIFQKFSNAQISLVDLSEEMLNISKKRLEKYENATYQILDYSKKLPNEKYDLIVSSLSIHHLDDNEKIELFSKIKKALCQNGIFINADQVLGENKEIEKIYQDNWLMEVKANNVTETALAEAIDRMKEDKMAPLSIQLKWLRNKGFSQVNCWYKNYRFAVYSGINKN